MDLEALLKDLRNVKGYMASGIATSAGEVIARDIAAPSLNLTLITALTNDVMLQAHEVGQKYSGTVTEETMIHATKGSVLIRCTGAEAKAHLHVTCVLGADGNVSLARVLMKKIAAAAADAL